MLVHFVVLGFNASKWIQFSTSSAIEVFVSSVTDNLQLIRTPEVNDESSQYRLVLTCSELFPRKTWVKSAIICMFTVKTGKRKKFFKAWSLLFALYWLIRSCVTLGSVLSWPCIYDTLPSGECHIKIQDSGLLWQYAFQSRGRKWRYQMMKSLKCKQTEVILLCMAKRRYLEMSSQSTHIIMHTTHNTKHTHIYSLSAVHSYNLYPVHIMSFWVVLCCVLAVWSRLGAFFLVCNLRCSCFLLFEAWLHYRVYEYNIRMIQQVWTRCVYLLILLVTTGKGKWKEYTSTPCNVSFLLKNLVANYARPHFWLYRISWPTNFNVFQH